MIGPFKIWKVSGHWSRRRERGNVECALVKWEGGWLGDDKWVLVKKGEQPGRREGINKYWSKKKVGGRDRVG